MEVIPAAEARGDADVVIQDEMLHQLAETDSSGVRADRNWEEKVELHKLGGVQLKSRFQFLVAPGEADLTRWPPPTRSKGTSSLDKM